MPMFDVDESNRENPKKLQIFTQMLGNKVIPEIISAKEKMCASSVALYKQAPDSSLGGNMLRFIWAQLFHSLRSICLHGIEYLLNTYAL